MSVVVFTNQYVDENVPMNLWGGDHWSTLAYIYTVVIDVTGFQVGNDPHMRQNRRHFRVMREECPKPKRVKNRSLTYGVVMEEKYSTRLSDGSQARGHDDWCCVQDMAACGFFDIEDVQPGETLHFSEKGLKYAEAVNRHKMFGGTFRTFDPKTLAEGEKIA